jgi:hypothetical protein
MDAETAKELLTEIKKADFSGIAGYVPFASSGSEDAPTAIAMRDYYNKKLQGDALGMIAKALGIGAGIGVATRGAIGLHDYLSKPKEVKSPRVIDMPIPYPKEKKKEQEKSADNRQATSMVGLNYFMPSMLLGAPLAAYGGWKAVDAVLNARRKAQVEKELEQAKKDYEKTIIGAYKKSAESTLDNIFNKLEKTAFSLDINKAFPNLSGMTQGAALTYGLTSLPVGYLIANEMMKKNTQRAVLRKAIEERARRQALYQPSEIYAKPVPMEEETESEKK